MNDIGSAGITIGGDGGYPWWAITHNGAVVGRAHWHGGALATAGEYLAYSAVGITIDAPVIVDVFGDEMEFWTIMRDGFPIGITRTQAEAHRFALERWREIVAGGLVGAAV